MQSSFGTTRGYAQVGHNDESERAESATGEAWAHLLAHTVNQRFFTVNGVEAEPPTAGDGSLTQRSGALDGGEGALASEGVAFRGSALPNQITGGIDAGDLGQLRFSITRGAAGLELVLNVESIEQKELAALESEALVRALESSGLRVRSLTIKGGEGAGTALALGSLAGANVTPRTSTPMQPQRHTQATRAYRQRPDEDGNQGDLDLLG
jgi:hypothetical protein